MQAKATSSAKALRSQCLKKVAEGGRKKREVDSKEGRALGE